MLMEVVSASSAIRELKMSRSVGRDIFLGAAKRGVGPRSDRLLEALLASTAAFAVSDSKM